MKLFLSLVYRFWWVWAIFVLVVAIAFTNHIPNTTLSGWDTLHPEFDLAGYTSRLINGAWQQHQGLGAPPSQAHAAELIRLPFLWLMSMIMPLNLVRYVFLFLMIYIGCIGVAVFVNAITISKSKSNLTGFMAAVFYLLSLVSVQQFYVPLEMFAVHYAVVPWLMLCLWNLMKVGDRKWILWFVLLSIIGAPQAHTSTLYYVLVGLMGIFVVVMAIGMWSMEKFWRGIVAILLGIVVNLYWIGPNIFYLVTRGDEVSQSKINYEFTPEAVLQNQAYGKIEDISIGRNFLFNWFDYSFSENKFIPLLSQWQKNFEYPVVSIIMYSFATSAFLGLLWVSFKKSKYRALGWSSLVLLATTVFFLINVNPPTGFIFNFLIEKFPIIGEGLRFPFTKFSIFYLFLMTIGFAVFFKYLFNLIKWKYLRYAVVIGVLACFGVAYSPIFNGGYVNKNMQVEIPTEYFKLFEFMKTQDMNKRIALMPIPNYWGWTYNDWTKYGYNNGYQGAGFLWFGLRQPLLNREFDRWSIYNEDFYHNIADSIYRGDYEYLSSVLNKYDIGYVLVDESVIAPGQGQEALRISETKEMLNEMGSKEVFTQGFLTVWDLGDRGNQFVSASNSYALVNGDTRKVREDVIWENVGHYISTAILPQNDSVANVIYPFAGLMREQIANVKYEDGKVTLSSESSPIIAQGSALSVPGWKVGDIVRIQYMDNEPLPAYYVNGQVGPRFLGDEKPELGENSIYARISDGPEWDEYVSERKFILPGLSLTIEVPGEPQIYNFATEGNKEISNCDILKRGTISKNENIFFSDKRGSICDYIIMGEKDTRLSYLMRIKGQNIEGRSPKFFLYNTGSKRNDIEYLLGERNFDQTFSLMPWNWDSYYTLNIDVRSFGQKTENILDPVEVRWIPLKQISEARIVNPDVNPTISTLRVIDVQKYGTWLYRVQVEGSGLLKLSQGYDEGWIAPPIEHVKVDGWANGWLIGASGVVTIFYWPQLLEYLGFVILGVTIIALIRKHE